MCKVAYFILFALVLHTVALSASASLAARPKEDDTISTNPDLKQKKQGNSNHNKSETSQQPTEKTKKAKPQKPSQAKLGKGNKHAGVAVEISLQSANNTADFEWTLVSITEVTPQGSVAAAFPNLTNLTFINVSSDPAKQRWSTTLSNGAEMIFELWSVSLAENITFASQVLRLLPDTIKQTLQISNWPWQNSSNHLELQLYLSDIDSNSSSVVSTQEDDGSLYLQLNSSVGIANGTALEVAVLKWAELDNATSALNVTAASDGLVVMSVPHFARTALLDPRFSVLIDIDTPSGGDGVIMPANTLSTQPTQAPTFSPNGTSPNGTSGTTTTETLAGSPLSTTEPSSDTTAPSARSSKSSSRTKMIIAGAVSGGIAIVAVAIAIALLLLRKNPAVRQVFHSTRHRRSSVVTPQTVTHQVI